MKEQHNVMHREILTINVTNTKIIFILEIVFVSRVTYIFSDKLTGRYVRIFSL
jgi:hypothetical protein